LREKEKRDCFRRVLLLDHLLKKQLLGGQGVRGSIRASYRLRLEVRRIGPGDEIRESQGQHID
jgi:hypothetical protein